MEARVLRLERERNMLKLEMDRQRMQFEEERQAWESQRHQMGADIMNEVYEKLRKDVGGMSAADAAAAPAAAPQHPTAAAAAAAAAEEDADGIRQGELEATVGSQGSSELRVSFSGLSATDESMLGSYEKPTSALPWKNRQQAAVQQEEQEEQWSPRRAGLPSPPRQNQNPLEGMMEPEPEPEPEPQLEPEHIAEQLRRSREQVRYALFVAFFIHLSPMKL
jgi:hypothetical protein